MEKEKVHLPTKFNLTEFLPNVYVTMLDYLLNVTVFIYDRFYHCDYCCIFIQFP